MISQKSKIYQGREDYLKALLKLSMRNEWVSNKDLSEELMVSAPSVSEMVRKLEQEDLVAVASYRGVRLTERGRNIATQLVRAHRLWEVFLIENLGYNWDEADRDAELLEHASNEKMTERLAAFLNYPTHCPHGAAIPDREGNFPSETQPEALSEQSTNCLYILTRVKEDPHLLNFLDEHDIGLGVKINLLEQYGDSYLVQFFDQDGKFQELELPEHFLTSLLVLPVQENE